jgi:hypothetical protein
VKLVIVTPRVDGRDRFWDQCLRSANTRPNDVLHLWNHPHLAWNSSGAAMNSLLETALYLGFSHYLLLSDDDFLLPGWYQALSAPVIEDPSLDMVYGDIATCGEDGELGRPWIPPTFNDHSVMWVPTLPGTGIIAMSVWQRAGGYPEWPGACDQALFATAHKKKPLKVHRIPGAFYAHRQWSGQESKRADKGALDKHLSDLR